MTTSSNPVATATPVDPARPWTDTSLPATSRAELLLDAMTLTEKVAQLGSFWDDRRTSDEIIAPMQDILSAGRGSFESVTRNGIGHLTRVLGTHPANAVDGAERLARAPEKVSSASRFGITAIAHEECLTGFTTLGATVYPTEVEQALRRIDGVKNAFVTDVSGRVGAVVIGDGPIGRLKAAARNLLSSFKIPTVWLLVDSDDAIPRGGTGKVDVAALRHMLTTRAEAGR